VSGKGDGNSERITRGRTCGSTRRKDYGKGGDKDERKE